MNLQKLMFLMLIVCLSIYPSLMDLPSSNIKVTDIESHPTKPSYEIKQHSPDVSFQQYEYKTYPGPIDGLTSQSSTWTGFYRQEGRDIFIDFSTPQGIKGVSLEFMQEVDKGILFPEFLDVFVSKDGQKWSQLGRSEVLSSSEGSQVQTKTISLVFPSIITRYIKVSFPVEQWVFARRLTFQYDKVDSPFNPADKSHHPKVNPKDSSFLSIKDTNDIALIFTGGHGRMGVWKKEEFAPMLSYLHPDGHLEGRMFDTFLFLPYPAITQHWRNWKEYLQDLFAKGQQLDALNEAAKQLHFKPKVILTLAYPAPYHYEFDRYSLHTDNALSFPFLLDEKEDLWKRKRWALEGYANQLWNKWNEAGFQHLELMGFYWFPETINQSIPHETELVQAASRFTHQKGLKFFWIPYFGSVGYDQWRKFGFDYVFLQPNYYATLTPAEDRMANTANIAKRHHLGMELELDERILTNRYYYDLFYKQLHHAKDLGLDQSVTLAYYLGGQKTLVDAAKSQVPEARQIYDDLYQWIKGTYEKGKKLK